MILEELSVRFQADAAPALTGISTLMQAMTGLTGQLSGLEGDFSAAGAQAAKSERQSASKSAPAISFRKLFIRYDSTHFTVYSSVLTALPSLTVSVSLRLNSSSKSK